MNPHSHPAESATGFEAFDLARKGETENLLILIEHGLDPDTVDAKGSSLLMLAAGAPVNGQSPDGRTPLIWAAAFNQPRALHLLLDSGAEAELAKAASRNGGSTC